MIIDTYRIKQYSSTSKTVVCCDGKPVCIVQGRGKTLSDIVSYIQGYDVKIFDGKVKRVLDRYRDKYLEECEVQKDADSN